MGKRKKAVPVRASPEKRKCLSWNMLDGEGEGSVSLIPDNDPSLQQEAHKAAQTAKQGPSDWDTVIPHRKHDLMDMFDLHVENCQFSISVQKQNLKKATWSCKFGEFRVQFSPGPLFLPLPKELPDSVPFTLHIGREGDKCIFCYNNAHETQTPSKGKKKNKHVDRDVKFWLVDIDLPVGCLEALRCRSFQLVIEGFSTDTMTLVIGILGTEAVLTKLGCPSEAVRCKGVNQSLLTLMEHFYRVVAPDYEDLPHTRKHNLDDLYAVIKRRHGLDPRPILPAVQHKDLLPVLRLYQQAGITWMLYKEKQDYFDIKENLHMLYTEVITKDGQTLYYNKYAGTLIRDRPLSVLGSPGGILGDEMGLGKTVEVLGLILHHPRDGVPGPRPLPVVKDEEIPKKENRKAKEKNRKRIKHLQYSDSEEPTSKEEKSKKKVKHLVFSDSKNTTSKEKKSKKKVKCLEYSDSEDTIIYSDLYESNKMDMSGAVKDQSCDNKGQSCDRSSQSEDICAGGSQDLVNINNSHTDCENIADDRLNGPACEEKVKTEENRQNSETDDNIKPMESIEEKPVKVENGAGDKCNNDTETTDIYDTAAKTEPLLADDSERAAGNRNTSAGSDASEDDRHFKNIFTERPASHREEFECICGSRKGKRRQQPVQCVACGLWQHADCVNYDLKDPLRGDFKCPHCHVASKPIVSGATLIISPFSIAHQWVDEILKHVPKQSLNVFMYTGVNKQGFIQPQTLARQDIVITTYETLRKELDYVDLPHNNSDSGRKLRHPKRFMALPSPIVAVEWWRICLDEAQMVECTTTKTAEMALRLTAVNRWCITGTPIQKGIDDLYGLLLFLGVDPYWVQQWWTKLLYDPFCRGVREPLYDLLTSVLWRTVKKDVLDQINIPAQTEHLQWLTFSPVEEHFYRRQYRDCVKLSMERLSKWTDSSMRLSSLDRHTVNQLLYPLVRLRQACCHPQAVRGEFIPIHKSTMTMEELLESLTKKARLEAEDSHRALVAAINGQAGLHIIQEEFVEAVEKYREVLRSVEEQKNILHTDSLQQLHAMHNLSELLASKPAGIAPTLRDDLLKKQISELKDKYMAKAIAFVKGTEQAVTPLQEDVKQLQRELNDGSEWWLEVIQWAVSREQDDVLMLKIKNDLLDNRNPAIGTLVRSCRDAIGLQYAIEVKISGINQAYKAVEKAMKGLQGPPTKRLIYQTTECCLRPVGEILKTCPFCKSEELFESYEAKLFSFVEKGTDQMAGTIAVNTRRQGTWADSEVERALKSILSFAKNLKAPEDLIEFGTVHIKLLDALKKEYKKLRTHWAGIKEHVGSFDELDMSTTRLRLRLPEEPKPDNPQLNVLERSELPQHKLKLSSDRIIAQGELRKKMGQLLYLTNLATNREDKTGGDNPEPCPICQNELGGEWSVMQCGHCFCIECMRIMADRASFGRQRFSVKCAVCRQTTYQSEISFVTTKSEIEFNDKDVRVLGSHSTKVEAVVRCLLNIKREDPTAKSLVFSTWTDVLSVIANALEENDITYRALYAAGKFQQNLATFKQSDDVTTLLLPVHSGANGLNLIEATNVLLVEPILNPAQELQAIGRVHRIGQSKPTNVYRFLVRGTIEQKMQLLLKSMDTKITGAANAEEASLTIGDLSSLFAQQLEDDNREGVQSMDEAETPSPTSDANTPPEFRAGGGDTAATEARSLGSKEGGADNGSLNPRPGTNGTVSVGTTPGTSGSGSVGTTPGTSGSVSVDASVIRPSSDSSPGVTCTESADVCGSLDSRPGIDSSELSASGAEVCRPDSSGADIAAVASVIRQGSDTSKTVDVCKPLDTGPGANTTNSTEPEVIMVDSDSSEDADDCILLNAKSGSINIQGSDDFKLSNVSQNGSFAIPEYSSVSRSDHGYIEGFDGSRSFITSGDKVATLMEDVEAPCTSSTIPATVGTSSEGCKSLNVALDESVFEEKLESDAEIQSTSVSVPAKVKLASADSGVGFSVSSEPDTDQGDQVVVEIC